MSKKLTMQQVEKFSKKRILKDFLEIQQNPLPNVVAFPLENRIYEWHGNILGINVYKDIVFHIIIYLPSDYPNIPPKIELCTFLEHEHVLHKGKWICLDMVTLLHSNLA